MARIAEIFECFALLFFVNLIELSDAAGEACGTILSVQLYCLTGYHCCDKDLYTCCATGYICAGSSCISIAVIIVPIIIVIVIIVVIVVIIVKKNNARQGVVIQPGQQQGIGNQPPSYDALGEACGTILSVQLYCPSSYHCCDTDLSTCCATGYFCAGTVCISIAAIIVPIIIVIVIIVVIVVIIVKKKNAQPGTVIHPGQPQVQVANYPSPGYGQGPAPY